VCFSIKKAPHPKMRGFLLKSTKLLYAEVHFQPPFSRSFNLFLVAASSAFTSASAAAFAATRSRSF